MANTCTENLFGISEHECDCYTNDLNTTIPASADEWYKESASGLFLDELESEGLISMRGANGTLQCDKALGTFYKQAREEALKRTADDVFTVISERFVNKLDSFSGRIGGKGFDRGLAIPNAVIAGVLLSPRPIIDGVFKLKSISLGSYVNRTGFVISIYRKIVHSDDAPVLVQNINDVTTVQGRVTTKTLIDPVILPLAVDGDPVEYLFIFTMDAGEQLANTSTSCGCGRKEHLFNQYASFQGITINAGASSLADYNKTTGYSYGIILDGEFTCETSAIVCRMFDKSSSWAKVYAYAARYLAASIVNYKVINAPDITRYSMVNFDEIRANALNFRGEYSNRLTWLAQNTDPSVNDCYKCDANGVMYKRGILR